MRKLTKVENKLKVLKEILSGERDLNSLRPPQDYCLWPDENGLYKIPGLNLLCNEEMLQQWLNTLRDCDNVVLFKTQESKAPLLNDIEVRRNVIVFEEAKTYGCDDALITNTHTVDVDYIEVDSTLLKKESDTKHKQKTKPVKTPEIKPQRPLPARLITSGKLSEYGITWGSIC